MGCCCLKRHGRYVKHVFFSLFDVFRGFQTFGGPENEKFSRNTQKKEKSQKFRMFSHPYQKFEKIDAQVLSLQGYKAEKGLKQPKLHFSVVSAIYIYVITSAFVLSPINCHLVGKLYLQGKGMLLIPGICLNNIVLVVLVTLQVIHGYCIAASCRPFRRVSTSQACHVA